MRRSTGREPGGVLRFVLVQLYSNMYSTAVCTLYSVHGIQLPQMYNLYSVQCTVYTVHCTDVHCVYSVQMYNLYRCTIGSCTLYTQYRFWETSRANMLVNMV